MPRGGISKARVREARDALVEQGRNPSVEAVRVALGNTGSNSTISRYLKELSGSALAPPVSLLGKELSTLIGSVAQRLVQDADARLAKERAALTTQQQAHCLERTHHLEHLSRLKESVVQLTRLLQEAEMRNQTLHDQIHQQAQSAEGEHQRLLQVARSQAHLLDERAEQIRSLREGLHQAQATLVMAQAEQQRERIESRIRHDRQVQALQSKVNDFKCRLSTQERTLLDTQARTQTLLQEHTALRERLRHQLLLVRQLRQDLRQRGVQLNQLQQMLERVIPATMG